MKLPARQPNRPSNRRRRYFFEQLEDRSLLAAVTAGLATCSTVVVNTNDAGSGSLREAINCANSTPGTQTISFNIPGSGVRTISPASALPSITDPVVIDGYTQPGASANTNNIDDPDPGKRAFNGTLLIELSGSLVGNANGLSISAENSTIRGLVINRFQGDGSFNQGNAILLQNSGGNLIVGNFLGTNATGTAQLGNDRGVYINSINNTIGGTTAAARNVISGNDVTGVNVASNGSIVQGNLIGAGASGTTTLGNGFDGIFVSGTNTLIGGPIPGSRNVVSGNGANIFLGSGTGSTVQGNLIGTDITGSVGLGSQFSYGVLIDAASNTIGGTAAGAGNTIAFNRWGVQIRAASAVQNAVLGDSIFGNGLIGIDLGADSATQNDSDDSDPGPNNLQNYPVILSDSVAGSQLTVAYAVPSTTTNSAYPLRVEFFKADTTGQGQTLLGFDTYAAAEASTVKTISFVSAAALVPGNKIVAAATDSAGNTSEFSAAFEVPGSNAPPVITSNGGGDTANVNVSENTIATADVDAIDTDSGQALTYSIVGGVDAGKFSINSSSGVLTFSSAPNYENSTDSDTNNVYQVVVGVSDGFDWDTQTLSVTVTNVNEPPVFATGNGGTTASINVAENITAVVDIDATDPEGSTVSFFKIGGADQNRFSLNTSTGVLAFFVPQNFESPADADHNNGYIVIVRATDGSQSSTQTITVNVTSVNEPPAITSNGSGDSALIGVLENSTAVTDVNANDPDAGATVTFSISGTDSDKFSIDPSSGLLTFNTAPDFESPTDDDHDNVYDLVVQATDGPLTDTQTLSVRVFDALENHAPVAVNDSAHVDEDNTLSVDPPGLLNNDTDVDANDTKTVIAVNGVMASVGTTISLASGALLNVASDGSYQYDPNGQFESLAAGQTATDSFNYTMTDSQGVAAAATVTIRIDGANDAPTAGDDQFTTDEDTPLVVAAEGLLSNDHDTDGDTLMIAPATQPQHGSLVFHIDGSFTYTPEKNYNGPDGFKYRVSDGKTTSNLATVSLTVNAVNDRPVVSLGGNVDVNEGTAFSAGGSFADPDNDNGGSGDSWTATVDYGDGTSGPLTLEANKTFALSHTYKDNSNYTVTVSVQDGGPLTGTASFQVHVHNVAPQQLSWSGPPQATIGEGVTFTGSFTDPGVLDTETASVDWGDGQTTDATVTGASGVWQISASHTFLVGGFHSVTVTVKDDDGDTATKSTGIGLGAGVLSGGVLEITGSEQRDDLKLTTANSMIVMSGTIGGTSITQSFALASVQRIMVFLRGGDDSFTVNSTIKQPLIINAGEGNDFVQAGGGPAVVIGGLGQDTLNGGAKQDLLIAGTTSYDDNEAALSAILSEWSSSRLYTARTKNLKTGIGPVLQGTGISLVLNKTVFNDASIDTLMGNGDFDWFMSDTKKDKIRFPTRGELIN